MNSPFGEREPVSLPYVVLTLADVKSIFRDLNPGPTRVTVKGYAHRASAAATLAHPEILMAFVLAEKGRDSAAPTFDIDLDLNG
jgi:hypothetical protein